MASSFSNLTAEPFDDGSCEVASASQLFNNTREAVEPPPYDYDHDHDIEPSVDIHDPQRFTAAGRPMPVHRNSRMAYSTLPLRFKDTSFILIPIAEADIQAALAEAPLASSPPSYGADAAANSDQAPASRQGSVDSDTAKSKKRGGFMSKLKKPFASSDAPPSFRTIRMTRAEYLAYFAKDERGAYICEEPRASGVWKQVIRMRLDDAELQAHGRVDSTRYELNLLEGGGDLLPG